MTAPKWGVSCEIENEETLGRVLGFLSLAGVRDLAFQPLVQRKALPAPAQVKRNPRAKEAAVIQKLREVGEGAIIDTATICRVVETQGYRPSAAYPILRWLMVNKNIKPVSNKHRDGRYTIVRLPNEESKAA